MHRILLALFAASEGGGLSCLLFAFLSSPRPADCWSGWSRSQTRKNPFLPALPYARTTPNHRWSPCDKRRENSDRVLMVPQPNRTEWVEWSGTISSFAVASVFLPLFAWHWGVFGQLFPARRAAHNKAKRCWITRTVKFSTSDQIWITKSVRISALCDG